MKKDKILTWDEWYNLAKIYYDHYHILKISKEFTTLDGYTFDKSGYALGLWIMHLQKLETILQLSDEQIDLLKEIGLNLKNKKLWLKRYYLTLKYFECHPNTMIPKNFKTLDGVDYDENGVDIYNWYQNNKSNFKLKMDNDERNDYWQKLLAYENNYKVNKDNLLWEKKYILAKNYYEHYHNLNIDINFKTLNGIDYDENGIKIGYWLYRQRQLVQSNQLDLDKFKRLLQIGFLLKPKVHMKDLIVLCEKHNIDIKKYSVLLTISYQVLNAKINFLIEHNWQIIVKNVPHEIFFLSNLDMQEKYGISLEQLIMQYFDYGEKIGDKNVFKRIR